MLRDLFKSPLAKTAERLWRELSSAREKIRFLEEENAMLKEHLGTQNQVLEHILDAMEEDRARPE